VTRIKGGDFRVMVDKDPRPWFVWRIVF